jgi:hypothetical protein
VNDPRAADEAWFAWDRIRRLTGQLQVALEQAKALARQLAEAVEAAEPGRGVQ